MDTLVEAEHMGEVVYLKSLITGQLRMLDLLGAACFLNHRVIKEKLKVVWLFLFESDLIHCECFFPQMLNSALMMRPIPLK